MSGQARLLSVRPWNMRGGSPMIRLRAKPRFCCENKERWSDGHALN